MKKLKLNLKEVGEILTRDQLKQVFGGSEGGGGCTYWYCTCHSGTGSWSGCYSSVEARNAAIKLHCVSEAAFCNGM